jgi:hypothetical protein
MPNLTATAQQDYEEKRNAARSAWQAFKALRDSAKAEGALDTQEAFVKLDEAGKAYDLARASADEAQERLARVKALECMAPGEGEGIPAMRADAEARREARSLLERMANRYTDSEIYKSLKESGRLRGKDQPLGTLPPVEILDRREVKTLVTSGSAVGGAFSVNDRTDLVEPLARRARLVLDLIQTGETDSDLVEYG